jgi:hypothetical protein
MMFTSPIDCKSKTSEEKFALKRNTPKIENELKRSAPILRHSATRQNIDLDSYTLYMYVVVPFCVISELGER